MTRRKWATDLQANEVLFIWDTELLITDITHDTRRVTITTFIGPRPATVYLNLFDAVYEQEPNGWRLEDDDDPYADPPPSTHPG